MSLPSLDNLVKTPLIEAYVLCVKTSVRYWKMIFSGSFSTQFFTLNTHYVKDIYD
jgi:hypothetical protein